MAQRKAHELLQSIGYTNTCKTNQFNTLYSSSSRTLQFGSFCWRNRRNIIMMRKEMIMPAESMDRPWLFSDHFGEPGSVISRHH